MKEADLRAELGRQEEALVSAGVAAASQLESERARLSEEADARVDRAERRYGEMLRERDAEMRELREQLQSLQASTSQELASRASAVAGLRA